MKTAIAFIVYLPSDIGYSEYFSRQDDLCDEIMEGFFVFPDRTDFQFTGHLIPPPVDYRVVDCGLSHTCNGEIFDFPKFFALQILGNSSLHNGQTQQQDTKLSPQIMPDSNAENVMTEIIVEKVAQSSDSHGRQFLESSSTGDLLQLCSIDSSHHLTFETVSFHTMHEAQSLISRYLPWSSLIDCPDTIVVKGILTVDHLSLSCTPPESQLPHR